MSKKIVVIGGTNIDVFAYVHQKVKLHDSNPGKLERSYGGVGRNIAENLALLSLNPVLITVVGEDKIGQDIIYQGTQSGIIFESIIVKETPTYIAIVDQNKDMVVAVSAMDEVAKLDVDQIKLREKLIGSADYLVLDTNYSQAVIDYVCSTFQNRICVDAISTQKAIKIIPHYKNIHMLKMNLMEAAFLSGVTCHQHEDIASMGTYFIDHGVGEVYITLGEDGAYAFDGKAHRFMKSAHHNIQNTTGAGDAFFAGVIYAKINKLDTLKYGIAASLIALSDAHAVSSNMSIDNLRNTIKEYQL